MKKILVVFTAVLLIYNCDARKTNSRRSTRTEKIEKDDSTSSAKQEIVLDCETGEVLSEKMAHERCVPSSMTKIMTLYLVFEALADGRLILNDELPVSEFAKNKEGSRSFFEVGTLAKVEDLIRSVAIHSGNDACAVLAEKLCGDEVAFAKLMNERAAEFGLKDTHFMNATGLPHEEHYSTMYDLAIIAKRIIEDFPQYYHYFSEKTFTVNGITQQNRNTLIGNSLHVDGLKTGKTYAGGYGIVISAKNDGKRLVVVVNGCKSAKSRAIEANKLLSLGFSEYMSLKISDKETPIGSVNVILGKRDKINLYTKEDIRISIPKKHRQSLVVELNVKEPIEAPIALGAKLGTLVYKYGNYVSKEYDLYTHEPIEKLNFFEQLISYVKSIFSKKTEKIEEPVGLRSASTK
jgi:D-alanyl-D-alanine carboxypeptidase (penicillin-binding protein 5/6)